MAENYKYRLEWNTNQQHFHLDNFTHEENTNDWATVCEGSDSVLSIFIDYMDKRYKLLKGRSRVTFGMVLKEWKFYSYILERQKVVKQTYTAEQLIKEFST